MTPLVSSNVLNNSAQALRQKIFTSFGTILKLRIPEFENESSKVSIVDLNGQAVAHLQVQAPGEVLWNTESVAKGIYFLSVGNYKAHLNLKIVVKCLQSY
jgi:hypothetical protein